MEFRIGQPAPMTEWDTIREWMIKKAPFVCNTLTGKITTEVLVGAYANEHDPEILKDTTHIAHQVAYHVVDSYWGEVIPANATWVFTPVIEGKDGYGEAVEDFATLESADKYMAEFYPGTKYTITKNKIS